MAIKLSISQRLRVSRPSDVSIHASNIETNLVLTWFIIGFKRTTGAPATVADLVEEYAFRFYEGAQRGSYRYGAEFAECTAYLERRTHDDHFAAAEAGDHMYLLVTSGTSSPPDGSATFDAIKSLGVLQA